MVGCSSTAHWHPAEIHVLQVSPLEQAHEIRQSVIEHPSAMQYSCFHLEHEGERINDFAQISDIKGLRSGSELRLVEDPYTEKEARLHMIRVRDLIGATGDRTDLVQGILSGVSLFDDVTARARDSLEAPADFDFAAAPKPETLVPLQSEVAPKTVKAIQLSPWNPPPAHLRQKGHLLYIIVTTLEGEQHQITSHVGGFFVNKSSNTKFDPFARPAPKAHAAHSLLNLIREISPSFDSFFTALQDFNGRRDPLSTFQITHAQPVAPWMVPPQSSPSCSHTPDITRTQEAFLIAGIENDSLRDWNEEFQSAKELPKDSVPDRVFRERLLTKLFADYTDAATRGAVLVARGEVAPLNPAEGHDAQIFVYNNVFFSFGADGVGTFISEGGDEAARTATGKDVSGVRLVNQLDIDGLYTPGTVVVDYLGQRVVGQSIVPGIFRQRDPSENQIDYGAVEGKDVVSADERFVPQFEKLSKALRVKKHAVWDKEGKRFDLEGSVETKGLMGTDARKYVLDLYRITPLDIIWRDDGGEDDEYPHRMTVLRPELVELFSRQKMRDWVNIELAKRSQIKEKKPRNDVQARPAEKNIAAADESEPADDAASEKPEQTEPEEDHIDMSKFSFALNPDAFSGQNPQTDEEKEQMTADEEDVRAAGAYLRDTTIPELLKDLRESEVGFPTDGLSLRQLLHKRGINLRYMGRIASMCQESRLTCLRDICVRDMIARAFKHVSAKYLRRLPLPVASACLSHLLNCLLGVGLNPKPVADVDPGMRALYGDADLGFEDLSPETVRESIETETRRRFRYALPANWHTEVRRTQLLREICLKTGIQLQSRSYVFTPEFPESGEEAKTNGANGHANGEAKKKKKKTHDGSPSSLSSPASAPHTFVPDDIANVVPVVKDSCPKSTLAEEALEGGKLSIAQNQRKLGQELLLESLSLHEQIYGILHPEVARVYHTLSMMYYYQLEEKDAAVELARKAIIVAERTIGADSQEALHNYLNLSLFLHHQGESGLALEYAKHALHLWKILYGPGHPDAITSINNAAVMLQSTKAYHESRRWFEESLRICEAVYGRASVNSATLLFQLAQALALDQDSKGAVARMRESYNVFLAELGPDDKNTKEAESWLEQLTQNAVSIAKHAKDVAARRLRAGIRLTPPRVPSASLTPSTGKPGSLASRVADKPTVDPRSIDELIKFIEGTDGKKKTSSAGKKRGGARANPKRRGSNALGVSSS